VHCGVQERARRVRDDREQQRAGEQDAREDGRLGASIGEASAEPVAEREEGEREPDDVRPDGVRTAEVRRQEARSPDLGRERRDPGQEDGRGQPSA
jgi:hypothetical protein